MCTANNLRQQAQLYTHQTCNTVMIMSSWYLRNIQRCSIAISKYSTGFLWSLLKVGGFPLLFTLADDYIARNTQLHLELLAFDKLPFKCSDTFDKSSSYYKIKHFYFHKVNHNFYFSINGLFNFNQSITMSRFRSL